MRPRSQGRAISGRLEEKHCPMEGTESEVPRREILKKQQQRGRKDRKREKTECGYSGQLAYPRVPALGPD